MKAIQLLVIIFLQASWTFALYSDDDDVVELTPENFESKVINSDNFWLVEFYAPWCGHCQRLAADWKQVASDLQGMVSVGAVNVDTHQSLGSRYSVSGFPTIKAFGWDKSSPSDYNGPRSVDALTEYAMKGMRDMVRDRKQGKKSGGGGGSGGRGGGGSGGGSNDVVTLTDSNFKELVLDSQTVWFVEFFAPWCGHCKNLEPKWKAAATEVKEKTEGTIKLGALDATVHQSTAGRYGIRGYPTIKIFRPGQDPIDYDGPRDANGIVARAMEYYDENIEPPTVDELISQDVFDEKCGKRLCIITFLPDIFESGKDGRNKYVQLLTDLGARFKKQKWGWLWAPALALSELEKAVNVGGFGYPAVVAINIRKEVYALYRGAFSETDLSPFLNVLTYGRGKLNTYPLSKLPEVKTREAWDGEDGQMPEEEEIDLTDFKWDDEL